MLWLVGGCWMVSQCAMLLPLMFCLLMISDLL